MPQIPTLPLLLGTCFSSHSTVSNVSVLSSTSWFPLGASMWGRISTNAPSDMYRPRTSWNTKM